METNVLETIETVAETVAETAAETEFVPNAVHFVENLSYMVSGMIGIFAVIGVIIIATVILNKVTAKKK